MATELDKVLATPVRAQIGGKEYVLTLSKKKIQAEFSAWLKARAKANLMDAVAGVDPEAVGFALTNFARDCDRGKYDFGGEASMEAIRTPDGMTMLLWLLLKPAQPRITRDDAAGLIVEHTADVDAAIGEVLERGKSTPPATAAT